MHSLSRRRLLKCAAVATAWPAGTVAHAQASKPAVAPQAAAGAPWRVVQLLDTSGEQQELSRNYATGLRLAWSRLSQRQGVLSRASLTTVNTDGSAADVARAIGTVAKDPSVLALVGSVGEALSLHAVQAGQAAELRIAHVAPWLSDARHDREPGVVPLFASRETQVRQALTAVRGMGIDRVDVVFPRADHQRLHAAEIERIAARLSLSVVMAAPAAGRPLADVIGRLRRERGGVLFVGGTIELALLADALAASGDRRFLFALADVDPATLQQLKPRAGTQIVLANVVPNPQNSRLACAVDYRGALKQLFDEDPTPASFAGYLAGQYFAHLVGRLGAPATRDNLFELARSRAATDLQGFPLGFSDGARGSTYVSQAMLTADGRLVG